MSMIPSDTIEIEKDASRRKDLARHALGLPNKNNLAYRNYYETSEDGQDKRDWQDMVEVGLAVQSSTTVFHVSLDGIRWALFRNEAIGKENMFGEDAGLQQLKRIHALETELKQKEAELSELKEGIPIEKAKESDGFYLVLIKGLTVGNKSYLQKHYRVMSYNILGWFDPHSGGHIEDEQVIKVYPLTTQISETQEGS